MDIGSNNSFRVEDAVAGGAASDEIPHVDKLLRFFNSRDIPYTSSQLSEELNITEHELQKTLDDLERLGYLHQMAILPGMEMIVPKKRLKSLDHNGVKVLKHKLNTLHH